MADGQLLSPLLNDIECRIVVEKALKLKPSHSMQILAYRTEPVGDDILGFLGEYFRLIIDIQLNVSSSKNTQIIVDNVVLLRTCI